LRLEYMHPYRDPMEVLAEERCKRPCATYQRTGSCQYGVACRYSHLTREEEARLQASVGKSEAWACNYWKSFV
uniref:C3H1-type domain-containing protein n=1 Tax=Hydatigena taeniaeformis TaxID=6205 RepID=A0A0R3WHV6_HYDTA